MATVATDIPCAQSVFRIHPSNMGATRAEEPFVASCANIQLVNLRQALRVASLKSSLVRFVVNDLVAKLTFVSIQEGICYLVINIQDGIGVNILFGCRRKQALWLHRPE